MNNAVLRSNNHSLRWCYVWNREKRKIEWTKYKIGSHLLRLSREIEGISPHWVGQYISLSDTAQPLNSEANEMKTEFFGFLRHTRKRKYETSKKFKFKMCTNTPTPVPQCGVCWYRCRKDVKEKICGVEKSRIKTNPVDIFTQRTLPLLKLGIFMLPYWENNRVYIFNHKNEM